jgi:hypothetical protein
MPECVAVKGLRGSGKGKKEKGKWWSALKKRSFGSNTEIGEDAECAGTERKGVRGSAVRPFGARGKQGKLAGMAA